MRTLLVKEMLLFTFLISAASTNAGIFPGSSNSDPDVQVPEHKSVRAACRHLSATQLLHDEVEREYRSIVPSASDRLYLGRIDNSEYARLTDDILERRKNSEQRLVAARVSVLRSAGDPDWRMYSRYSIRGAGDLWDSNVVAGERVMNNRNHRHYRFTEVAGWQLRADYVCKKT